MWSQDQSRILETITHSFPSKAWIHKITRSKNPITVTCVKPSGLDLGHIQHTCESLSEGHTVAHHRYWRLIHRELPRLSSVKWRFMCILGEKNLETIWKELQEEFEEELK